MDLKVLGHSRANKENKNGKVEITYHLKEIVGTLKQPSGNQQDFIVYMPTKLTNTPVKSTEKTLEKRNSMRETSQKSLPMTYQTTTYSVADFLARLSALLGNGKDLKIHEVLSSLILQGYSLPKDLDIYFLKMSKDSFRMMTDIRSGQFSGSCMNYGTTFNGKCLTARISESHRIGKECSLSDILEDQVDQKYFLSEESVKKLDTIMNATKQPQSISTIVSQKLQPGEAE